MSSIYFGGTTSIIDAATPSTGWLIAYDTDGVLKQKDEFGVITLISNTSSGIGSTPSLSDVLSISNQSGSYGIVMGTSTSISSVNGSAQLSLDFGTSSKVRLTNGSNSLLLSNGSDSSLSFLTSLTFSITNTTNTFRIDTNTFLSSQNEFRLRVFNTADNFLVKSNVGASVTTSNVNSNAAVFINTRNSSIDSNLVNTVVIGGNGLSALNSNSVYVPDLYIQNGKFLRGTEGNGRIKLDTENNLVLATDDSLIAILSSTNSEVYTINGIIVSDTNSSVSSPNAASGIAFISSQNSNSDAGVLNSVIIGGQNLIATQSDTVYLGNNVNINNEYTFPSLDGSVGQVMMTDGSGNIYWTTTAETQNLTNVLFNGNNTGTYDIIFGTSTSILSSNSNVEISLDYSGSTNSVILSTDNLSLSTSYFLLGEQEASLFVDGQLNIEATESVITTSNNRGLIYSADYSSTFVTHSLIDKNYLDSSTSSIWGYISNSLISGITAGNGLSGGGTYGYLSIDVNLEENSGLTFSSDKINLELNTDSLEVDVNNQLRLTDSISGNRTFTDSVYINGDLTVSGTQTYVFTQELHIADSNITLLATFSSGSPFLDSGINVSRGSSQSASFIWNESIDYWQIGLSGSESTIITENGPGLLKNNNELYIDFATVSSVTYVDNATASLYNYVDSKSVEAGSGLTQSSGIIKLGGKISETTTINGATALSTTNTFTLQNFYGIYLESTTLSTLEIDQAGVNAYSPSGNNFITVKDGTTNVQIVSYGNYIEVSEYETIFSNQITIGDLIGGGSASNGMIRFNGSNFQGYKSGGWINLDTSSSGTQKYSATASFTSGVTQSISHNLNSDDLIVQTYDSSGIQIIPGNIQVTGTSSVDIMISSSLSSVKIVIIG